MKTSLLLALTLTGTAFAYDPLNAPGTATPVELLVTDTSRRREIPVRVYLPAAEQPAAVLLYSHGLGGTRAGSAFLGCHWAARGYLVVYLQHPGSDAAIWQDQPPAKRLRTLRQAANAENFLRRIHDVTAVLDQLAAWNKTTGHPLAGRLDLNRVGMSGHSFGAVTTQAVSGQHFPFGGTRHTDPRIKAAIAFSPSAPAFGDSKKAFNTVQIPWLLITGTKDVALIGHADVAARRAVYAALSPGGKYELVLDRAEHSAFTDRALPGDVEPRNPNHHRALLAISTAFWDAHLAGNSAAKTWLAGPGPRRVLEPSDEWQQK